MQKTIKKLFVNDMQTKYGAKKKFDIYIDGTNGEFKFSAWVGKWNEMWKIGDMIEVPDINDTRWKQSEYNGNTSYTLGAPPEAFSQFGSQSQPQMQTAPQQPPVSSQSPPPAPGIDLTDIERRLTDVEKEIAILKLNQVEKEIEAEDIPIIDTSEPKLENIPY